VSRLRVGKDERSISNSVGTRERAENAQKSSRNGLTSDSKDAIACAASPLRPAEAAVAVASIADVDARELDPNGALSEGGKGAALDDGAPLAELEMVRSGMTNDPSCMRSGPETVPVVGVVVSHSQESNDAAGGRPVVAEGEGKYVTGGCPFAAPLPFARSGSGWENCG
jgi:hypothetical protein